MEAETAVAAARQRREKAEEARAKATAAHDADAPAAEQVALNKQAEAATAKAKEARDHQLIVAEGASNQPHDFEHLEPILERIATTAGALPDVMTMDAGYWTDENAKACADQGIDAYIATGLLPHGQPQ